MKPFFFEVFMGLFFDKTRRLEVFGDGCGFVVFSEFEDDSSQPVASVAVPVDRFIEVTEFAKMLAEEATGKRSE